MLLQRIKMKNKNLICLFSRHPVFNIKYVPVFEKLNQKNSVYLNTLLLSNYLDLIHKIELKADFACLLDERDKEFVSINYLPAKFNLYYYHPGVKESFAGLLSANNPANYSKSVLIDANSMGVSENTINKILDLLSIEDASIIIGRTTKNKLAFMGVNRYDEELNSGFQAAHFNYDKFLAGISTKNYFLTVLDGFLALNDFDDFRELYFRLSKKNSLAYCSEEMHEKFNNIFIEYKDYLK